MRLHRFPGGLKLAPNKLGAAQSELVPAPCPARVSIPLLQHAGLPAEPLVAVGDSVVRGQCIARINDGLGAPVHASISGTVSALNERDTAQGALGRSLCIEIDSDGRDACITMPAIDDPSQAEPEDLRARIDEAGIVGLGGAAFPTAAKLAVARGLLIINGAECEPWISCDDALLRAHAAEVVAGALVLRRICGAAEIQIAVEDSMREALAALRAVLQSPDAALQGCFTFIEESPALESEPAPEGAPPVLRLVRVPTVYPAGGERQLIKVLTGFEVPSGGLPRDLGVLCQNVGTARAVWRAVRHGEALTSRVVTITGRGIRRPCVVEARIGTAVSDLVALAGGYAESAERLLIGGPMMGLALPHDQFALTKSGNCVLVLSAQEVRPTAPEMPCIRCGECVRVCPAQLLPQQLAWYVRAGEWDRVREHALSDCIECGCCALVCPSQIPLVDWYRHGKSELRIAEHDARAAEAARQRHEARQLRLENEAREREDRRIARARAVSPDALKLALSRARSPNRPMDPEQDA